jgi:hypothetical protein
MTLKYAMIVRLIVPDRLFSLIFGCRPKKEGDPLVNAVCADELPPLERRFAKQHPGRVFFFYGRRTLEGKTGTRY